MYYVLTEIVERNNDDVSFTNNNSGFFLSFQLFIIVVCDSKNNKSHFEYETQKYNKNYIFSKITDFI